MSTPTKKAHSGRKSSYDDTSADDRKHRSNQVRFHSSSRDASLREGSSSGDAHNRKDVIGRRYNTRSASSKPALRLSHLSDNSTNSATSSGSAAASKLSTRDDGANLNEFQLADGFPVSSSDRVLRNEQAIMQPMAIDNTAGAEAFPALRNKAANSDVIPDAAEEDSRYNFTATAETPPRDNCLARDCFNEALNQTAADYVAMRERRRLRDMELDLLMGTLGAANQDEIISVDDIREFTENRIASFGISSVSFITTASDVEVSTSGELTYTETFPLEELPSRDETVIFNGNISPFPTPREGREDYPLSGGRYDDGSCTLCGSNTVLHQFETLHRKENLKHLLAHKVGLENVSEEFGEVYETVFSADVSLIYSNYDRPYNFLPTASSMQEAVEIVRFDDHIPTSQWMDDFQIIESGVQCIAGLPLPKLLKFYYCIVNSTYDIRGSSIRHVQMCRSDVPTH